MDDESYLDVSEHLEVSDMRTLNVIPPTRGFNYNPAVTSRHGSTQGSFKILSPRVRVETNQNKNNLKVPLQTWFNQESNVLSPQKDLSNSQFRNPCSSAKQNRKDTTDDLSLSKFSDDFTHQLQKSPYPKMHLKFTPSSQKIQETEIPYECDSGLVSKESSIFFYDGPPIPNYQKDLAPNATAPVRPQINSFREHSNKSLSTHDRLIQSQKEQQEKLTEKRLFLKQQELNEIKQAPTINEISNKIMKSLGKQAPIEDRAEEYIQHKKKEEKLRIKILEEREKIGFTGRPEITEKSKAIARNLDNLFEWDKQRKKQIEEEKIKRGMEAEEDFERMQKSKNIASGTERIMSGKNRGPGKIEERLLNKGKEAQNKKNLATRKFEEELAEQRVFKSVNNEKLEKSKKASIALTKPSKDELRISTEEKEGDATEVRKHILTRYFADKSKKSTPTSANRNRVTFGSSKENNFQSLNSTKSNMKSPKNSMSKEKFINPYLTNEPTSKIFVNKSTLKDSTNNVNNNNPISARNDKPQSGSTEETVKTPVKKALYQSLFSKIASMNGTLKKYEDENVVNDIIKKRSKSIHEGEPTSFEVIRNDLNKNKEVSKKHQSSNSVVQSKEKDRAYKIINSILDKDDDMIRTDPQTLTTGFSSPYEWTEKNANPDMGAQNAQSFQDLIQTQRCPPANQRHQKSNSHSHTSLHVKNYRTIPQQQQLPQQKGALKQVVEEPEKVNLQSKMAQLKNKYHQRLKSEVLSPEESPINSKREDPQFEEEPQIQEDLLNSQRLKEQESWLKQQFEQLKSHEMYLNAEKEKYEFMVRGRTKSSDVKNYTPNIFTASPPSNGPARGVDFISHGYSQSFNPQQNMSQHETAFAKYSVPKIYAFSPQTYEQNFIITGNLNRSLSPNRKGGVIPEAQMILKKSDTLKSNPTNKKYLHPTSSARLKQKKSESPKRNKSKKSRLPIQADSKVPLNFNQTQVTNDFLKRNEKWNYDKKMKMEHARIAREVKTREELVFEPNIQRKQQHKSGQMSDLGINGFETFNENFFSPLKYAQKLKTANFSTVNFEAEDRIGSKVSKKESQRPTESNSIDLETSQLSIGNVVHEKNAVKTSNTNILHLNPGESHMTNTIYPQTQRYRTNSQLSGALLQTQKRDSQRNHNYDIEGESISVGDGQRHYMPLSHRLNRVENL